MLKIESDSIVSLFIELATIELWLGGVEGGNDWKWGGSWRSFTYTAWIPNEPNGMNEKCLQYYCLSDYHTGWNDQDCPDEHNFICEYKLK